MAKKVEMAWSYVKNGAYSACENRAGMDSWGTKESGALNNNMAQNGIGGIEDRCYSRLGESYKTSPR